MSKKKPSEVPAEPPSNPSKKQPVLYLRPPEELNLAIEEYLNSLDYKVDKNAFGCRVIQKFLEKEGFYPPKKSPDA